MRTPSHIKLVVILCALSVGFLIFSVDVFLSSRQETQNGVPAAGTTTTSAGAIPSLLPAADLAADADPPAGEHIPPPQPPAPSVFAPFFDDFTDPEPLFPTIDVKNDVFLPNTFTVSHPEFIVSDELRERIETAVRNYPRRVAFYVLTLDETLSFGYNPDSHFPTASTIKAPYALFCYKQIAKERHSLYDLKEYERKHYTEGSGIIRRHRVGSVYTIEQILYYTIYHSDNVAYYMAIDHFGREGYNEMLEEIGTTHLYLRHGRRWSETTPRDSVLVWREILAFTGEGHTAGGIFYDTLLNATANLLDGALPHYTTLHKSGWTNAEYHDAGIVYAPLPYHVAIMTNGSTADRIFVRDMLRNIDAVVAEYHNFLMEQIN